MAEAAAAKKDSPAFWRAIKPGDFITLKDVETLTANMQAADGDELGDLEVRLVRRLSEMDQLAEWILIYLDTPQKLVLLATIVDELVSLRLMFQPKEWIAGNRRQIIDRGDHGWLFLPPADEANFSLNELAYTDGTIEVPLPGGNAKAVYGYKGNQFSCTVKENPRRQKGRGTMIATIAEYGSPDESLANRELVVVEIGLAENVDGGLIGLHVGAPIEFADVDVIRSA